jgi:regulator of sigma E protease
MDTFIDYVLTGCAFFVIFSVIVLIHEGGHFWAARLGKIGIEEFGFGLPPRLWGKKNKKSGVLYSLNWIPFGGFVRMLGEDDPKNEKAKKHPNAFNNRPLWARIFAVSAGVLMNFLLGWILLVIGFIVGMKPIIVDESDRNKAIERGIAIVDESGVFVSGVQEGSPAERAGILPGDFIASLDTTPVKNREDFLKAKEQGLRGEGYHVAVIRKDYSQNIEGDLEKNFLAVISPNEEGNLGLYLSETPLILVKEKKYPLQEAVVMASGEIWRLSKFTVIKLGDLLSLMISKFTIPEGIGGPVAIAQVTHHFVTSERGVELLKLAALLSISIGVINIMPFPALDGGRLVFLLFELVTRKRPNAKMETMIHAVGFAFLLLLLLAVTWNDLVNIFAR